MNFFNNAQLLGGKFSQGKQNVKSVQGKGQKIFFTLFHLVMYVRNFQTLDLKKIL